MARHLGGHCRSKCFPMKMIAVGVNFQVFPYSNWCLRTGKYNFRLEIKACSGKTMLYHFYYSQNQGGQKKIYRITFWIVLDCYITDSNVFFIPNLYFFYLNILLKARQKNWMHYSQKDNPSTINFPPPPGQSSFP